MGALPTADEAFGPAPQGKPTAAEAFGPEQNSPPATGTFFDTYYSNPAKAETRILNAFGQGTKDAWGSEPLGLSQETQDYLRKAGLFNDYNAGQNNVFKSFNEALFRPAAAVLDTLNRTVQSVVNAAASGTYQAGIEAGFSEEGAKVIPQLIGYETQRGDILVDHVPQATPATVALTRARALKVIGEGEGGYFGAAPAPETAAAHAEAVKADSINMAAEVPPPVPDIHAVARQVAPETFQEYDALAARRDQYRAQLADMATQRAQLPDAVDAQSKIDTILSKVNGVEDRLTGAASQRLDTARENLDTILRKDTPEMADTRKALMESDFRMRDLASQVASAYREAQAQIPEQPESVVQTEAQAPQETMPAEQPKVVPAPAEVAPELGVPKVAGEQTQGGTIAQDVSQKLVSAGRPQEEADAAAAIVQAHYEARAQRFGGQLGTPQELYARDAPNIKGAGRKRAVEMAQPTNKTLHQSRRASITLGEARNTIKLFKDADASSFLHETGHQWLEELTADAADERAPADLKTDAKTVRDWLGANEGEEIKRAQHEKFARGFERYLMEGVAPSKALASVFAKFRQWLTQIYQTVNKLRSPINDDIRAVFDRLITANPERTVIAPERAIETSMADIHEAEAAHTPPERAEPVADQIRSEIDAVAKEKIPDVHAELAKAGGIADENANPPSGANEGQQSVPPESVAGVGEKPASGNKTAPESSDNPDARFPAPEPEFIDKAGNIRLDNINTTADVDQYIKQASEDADHFIGARRGVVSDQEVLDLASSMGIRPQDLNVAKLRSEFSPEKVVAVRKLFVQTATEAYGLSEKAAMGTEADVIAYAEARSRLRMVHEYLAAITAETGRTLRAFRKLEGTDYAKGIVELMGDLAQEKTLNQLKQEAGRVRKLDSASKVSGFLHDSDKPGLGAMALEMFQNWLIAGPLTHMGYSVGNTVLALYKAVPETLAEAGFGFLKEKFTGTKQERVYAGEAAAQLYALFRGQRNGFQAAYDSLLSGQTTALPGEVDAINAGRTEDKKVSTPFTQGKAIPNFEVGGVKIPLGSIIRSPGERMVAPIHSYFRSLGYAQSIARQAFRMATQEGLTGQKFDARIADLTVHPTLDMMESARNEATEQTLMGRGGDLTQRVSQFVNWNPKIIGLGPTKPLRFIDPFVHIASNIVEQSVVERSPLGILSNKVRQDLKGENGNIAQANAAARMAVGTALSIVGGGLAMEGLITPSAPSDPHEAAIWRMTNGMPHSVRFGDMSFDLSRMGVLGFQLGIAADLYHFADSIGKTDSTKLASLLVHSFTQNFLDEGFMRGPSDLIKALNDPDRYGGNWIKNFVASFATPFSVGMAQVASQIDPYSRQARTMLDAIIQKIPFASETLYPRRDLWGQPIPNRDWFLTYNQAVQTDPATKAIMSVGEQTGWFPSPVEQKIRGIQLTGQQYDDYSRIAGRLARMRIMPIVSTPGWDQFPPEVKLDQIRSTFVGTREAARSLIMMQNPDIIQAARKAKISPIGAAVH